MSGKMDSEYFSSFFLLSTMNFPEHRIENTRKVTLKGAEEKTALLPTP